MALASKMNVAMRQRHSRMMVSESGSPASTIGWKTGRDAGSAGVGRLNTRPDRSRCCLNSASVIRGAFLRSCSKASSSAIEPLVHRRRRNAIPPGAVWRRRQERACRPRPRSTCTRAP